MDFAQLWGVHGQGSVTPTLIQSRMTGVKLPRTAVQTRQPNLGPTKGGGLSWSGCVQRERIIPKVFEPMTGSYC